MQRIILTVPPVASSLEAILLDSADQAIILDASNAPSVVALLSIKRGASPSQASLYVSLLSQIIQPFDPNLSI